MMIWVNLDCVHIWVIPVIWGNLDGVHIWGNLVIWGNLDGAILSDGVCTSGAIW
jgi:hypothetical protein